MATRFPITDREGSHRMMTRPADSENIPQRATGLKRVLYIVVGIICVGLAVVGALIPGIPTTPWVLLASYCFARSSTRLDRWLRNAPIFGKLIRDWNQYHGVNRRTKIRAVCFVVVVVSLSITFSPLPGWVKVVIGFWAIIGICTILFVVPTIKRVSETIDK